MKLIESDRIENITCDKVKPGEVENIINNIAPQMFDLIKNEKKALAIAAPQIGIFKRFFIFKNGNQYYIVLNPIYSKDGSMIKSAESCLSYGLDNFTTVKRFKSVKVKCDEWVDKKLVSKVSSVKYPVSIMMQHEIDHLNGRTIFCQ